MSILDFKDRLDAERAIRDAEKQGDSNSILAFRDRLDAKMLVDSYNRTQESLRPYREKVAGRSVEVDRIEWDGYRFL